LTQSSRLLGLTLYPVYILFDLHFFYHGAKHALSKWKIICWKWRLYVFSFYDREISYHDSYLALFGANYFNHLPELLNISKSFLEQQRIVYGPGNSQHPSSLDLSAGLVFNHDASFYSFFSGGFFYFYQKQNDQSALYPHMGVAVTVNAAFYFGFKAGTL
jgi:hypothetical protein